MLFSHLPRVRLLEEATPLLPLEHLGRQLGRQDLWIKRDDLMPLGGGGNKVRSLEFWLGQALQQGADTIIAAGLPASNLCRLTAAACARLGLPCILVHNAGQPAPLQGNSLLNELMGARTLYCGAVDEEARGAYVQALAGSLRAEGRRPYVVGDPAIGALGYVAAALEFAAQAERLSQPVQHLFISASAGPTEAGLLFGLSLLGTSFHLHMVSVEYEEAVFWQLCRPILVQLGHLLGVQPAVDPMQIATFYGDFLGPGYALPTPSCLQAVRRLAAAEGIFLETTYNAKVLDGMLTLLQREALPPGEGVCLWDTGGFPALFGQGAQFASPQP